MSFFAKFKNALSGATSKINGRKDFLEAVAAAAALMASADGNVSDDEVIATQAAAKANPQLKASFTEPDIDKAIDTMLERAKNGRSGRLSLTKEIKDIAADKDVAAIVMCIALDVADADGSFSEPEKATAKTIADALGLKVSDYLSI